jgi:hypothetical protein
MITAKQNAAAIAGNPEFIRLVTEFKALVAAQGLPLSLDMSMLETAYKTQLFHKLLGVDKGLKMRFEMLKSDEARLKLVADTIDLTGYDVIDTIAEAVKRLETLYKNIWAGSYGSLSSWMSFQQFFDVYGLDLAAALDAYTFDWTGKEFALEYFAQLGQQLEHVRNILRVTMSSHYDLHNACNVLSRFFDGAGDAEIVPEEGAVMRLVKDLTKAGKLDLIPRK